MIPVFKPLIEQEEIDASRQSLELGWLGMGSYVSEFENQVKQIIGVEDRYVAALSTGTAGLHLALLVAGVGPGDEVIVSSFNCSADFQAISWVGAEIVFCDCVDDSLAIDIKQAEKLVTPKTKAIIVMDYDCMLCDHDEIARFAEQYKLRVIHDAAHSFGSKYKGKPVGSFSDICVFSHDPVKTVTCLDGGTIVVRTKEELAMVHELRLLGMQQPASVMYQNQRAWTFDVERVGFRYHMLNMHAAIGLAQLSKLDIISSTRREASRRYNALLASVAQVRTPNTDFTDVNPFLYYIRVDAEDRDPLRVFLKENGVDTGIHWQPGHWFSLWKNCKAGDLTVTERVGNEILSLPLHSRMDMNMVDEVCRQIGRYFEGKGKMMANRALFDAYKQSAGSKHDLVLTLGCPVEAVLRPIATDPARLNAQDVRLLSEWRNRFVKSFLTEFHSHDERTANWLVNAVGRNAGKLMFMVDGLDGVPIGHVGIGFTDWETGYVEADAIVRGGEARKGLMKDALRLLLDWTRDTLGLPDIWVRVRSDNPALAFYEKCGFVETKRVPLACKTEGEMTSWFEDPSAGSAAPALVYMEYRN